MIDTIKDGKLHISFPVGNKSISHTYKAEVGVVTRIHEPLPSYTGNTVITPSLETQILETKLKTVEENIIVNPIPSNYGRLEWNGQTLRVF